MLMYMVLAVIWDHPEVCVLCCPWRQSGWISVIKGALGTMWKSIIVLLLPAMSKEASFGVILMTATNNGK